MSLACVSSRFDPTGTDCASAPGVRPRPSCRSATTPPHPAPPPPPPPPTPLPSLREHAASSVRCSSIQISWPRTLGDPLGEKARGARGRGGGLSRAGELDGAGGGAGRGGEGVNWMSGDLRKSLAGDGGSAGGWVS